MLADFCQSLQKAADPPYSKEEGARVRTPS